MMGIGIWNAFVPMLNKLEKVDLMYVPGHCGVGGNERVDRAAREVGGRIGRVPIFWDGIDLRHGLAGAHKKARKQEWLAWHVAGGHDYYPRLPNNPRHMMGWSRMDVMVLLRVRSGLVI